MMIVVRLMMTGSLKGGEGVLVTARILEFWNSGISRWKTPEPVPVIMSLAAYEVGCQRIHFNESTL